MNPNMTMGDFNPMAEESLVTVPGHNRSSKESSDSSSDPKEAIIVIGSLTIDKEWSDTTNWTHGEASEHKNSIRHHI